MINSHEISVVIQGAVTGTTERLVRSIRTFLPESEIILSTWRGAIVDGFACDEVIFNQDPGAVSASVDVRRKFNLNRQIVSSKNGVLAASRPYILKCRSDMELLGTGFLHFWDMYETRDSKFSYAEHKILIPSLYTIKGETEGDKFHPTPFHISDWYAFGLKDDIVELFSVPMVDDEDFSMFFSRHEKPREYNILWLNERYWRYAPEQYFGVTYAQKKMGNIDFPNCLAYDNVDFEAAERFLVNNFTVVEPAEFQLILNKDAYYDMSRDLTQCPKHIQKTIYSRFLYEYDYKKYCDPEFMPEKRQLSVWSNDNAFLDEILMRYKEAVRGYRSEEYDLAIVTPTFSGHFRFIENYLKSFCQYVQDKAQVPVYFTVNRSEFVEFCGIIAPYADQANIHVLIFEDILNKYGVEESPEKLLKKYGRFSFQTLKKLYTMLFIGKSKYLVLDSESMWIQPVVMRDEFERFFKEPFIPYSPLENMASSVLPRFAVENIEYLYATALNKWCLEFFCWFYDSKILNDLFLKYGMPIDLVKKVYKYDQTRSRNVGVFEILLYTLFIDKNAEKYGYTFKNVYAELSSKMSQKEFSTFSSRLKELYHGEAGYCEHLPLLLTERNWMSIAEMCSENNFTILRCETSGLQNYLLQKRFMGRSNTKILAASQDNWWARPLTCKGFIRAILKSCKEIAKTVMRHILPAYRVGVDTRIKVEDGIRDMNRRIDQITWDNIWNQACVKQGAPCSSLDVLQLQKLDAIQWIIQNIGEEGLQQKTVLIIGDDYGDWGIPFLSLGARLVFLNTRKETNFVIERRFPASVVALSAAELKSKSKASNFDVAINVSCLYNQPFKDSLLSELQVQCYISTLELRTGVSIQAEDEQEGEISKLIPKNSGVFGFCPILPSQAIRKIQFDIYENKGEIML